MYKGHQFPVLSQITSLTYLGISLIPTLIWHLQKQTTTSNIEAKCQTLILSPATINQFKKILNASPHTKIAYAFYAIPFSKPNITQLDKILIHLAKSICRVPNSSPNLLTQLPHEDFGMNTISLILHYVTCLGTQLSHALNNLGKLGCIYQGLVKYITVVNGG